MGIIWRFKLDEKLFRYTRNVHEIQLIECQFTDDAAILTTTHAGTEIAMREFVRVATDFILKVSFQKTKMMVVGREVTNTKTDPLLVGTEEIECVKEFTYLGSAMASSGRVDAEVMKRTAQASRAFGTLRQVWWSPRDQMV